MNLLWAVSASIIVSAISLIGIFSFFMRSKTFENLLILLIGFSAGGLMGGAFFHLLPEALEKLNVVQAHLYLLAGFIMFFILERYFRWHHCHDEKCAVHPFSYLSLFGDGIHNFIDGLIIGTSFSINIPFGVITTAAIISHEIPQEIGDFGILVYGGFSKQKALFYNFLSSLSAVLGTVMGFYFSGNLSPFSAAILPFAAGGFIYIASCDLVPELHKQADLRKATLSMLFFLLGIALVFAIKMLHPH